MKTTAPSSTKAKASEERELHLRFEDSGGSPSWAFYRDSAGRWFTALTQNDDAPCPADAEPLSAREALELFLERVDNSEGSLGDMNDAIRDLLDEAA